MQPAVVVARIARTKDFDDVYVLRQASGASTEAVKTFLESLRAPAR